MKKFFLFAIIIAASCTNKEDDNINGTACTEEFVYGLTVIVRDANSQEIIAEDVSVRAVDGGFSEELRRFMSLGSYVGAGERAGTYVLNVIAPNYRAFTSEEIAVGEDECHVIPQLVNIELTPN